MAWSCQFHDWASLAAAMASSAVMREVVKRHSRRASVQRSRATSSRALAMPGASATFSSNFASTGAGSWFRL